MNWTDKLLFSTYDEFRALSSLQKEELFALLLPEQTNQLDKIIDFIPGLNIEDASWEEFVPFISSLLAVDKIFDASLSDEDLYRVLREQVILNIYYNQVITIFILREKISFLNFIAKQHQIDNSLFWNIYPNVFPLLSILNLEVITLKEILISFYDIFNNTNEFSANQGDLFISSLVKADYKKSIELLDHTISTNVLDSLPVLYSLLLNILEIHNEGKGKVITTIASLAAQYTEDIYIQKINLTILETLYYKSEISFKAMQDAIEITKHAIHNITDLEVNFYTKIFLQDDNHYEEARERIVALRDKTDPDIFIRNVTAGFNRFSKSIRKDQILDLIFGVNFTERSYKDIESILYTLVVENNVNAWKYIESIFLKNENIWEYSANHIIAHLVSKHNGASIITEWITGNNKQLVQRGLSFIPIYHLFTLNSQIILSLSDKDIITLFDRLTLGLILGKGLFEILNNITTLIDDNKILSNQVQLIMFNTMIDLPNTSDSFMEQSNLTFSKIMSGAYKNFTEHKGKKEEVYNLRELHPNYSTSRKFNYYHRQSLTKISEEIRTQRNDLLSSLFPRVNILRGDRTFFMKPGSREFNDPNPFTQFSHSVEAPKSAYANPELHSYLSYLALRGIVDEQEE